MTVAEVMELRESAGFRSPLRPLERGDWWLLFAGRGVYEWALHPDDAFPALIHGIEVEGRRLPCKLVDALPMMGALQVRATDPDRPSGFVDSAGAA